MNKKNESKMFAYEAFMDQARKEGRVRNETLSMKVLKPDLSLQARVNHIDKDHVRALHEILKNGQPLAPIVVFEISVGKFKIADGFHRHEVYRQERLLGIPCAVVKGTLQEAIEYAASCNQNLSLKRTREDIRKAIFMLLDSGWLQKSSPLIAKQVGTSQPTVDKYRAAYCLEREIAVPTTIVDASGVVRRKRKRLDEPARLIERDKGDGHRDYRANVGRKTYYLGTDRDSAEAKLKEMDGERKGVLSKSVSFTMLTQAAASRGVGLLPASSGDDLSLIHVPGYRTGTAAVAVWEDGRAEGLLKAVGSVVLIAGHWNLKEKIVIKKSDDHAFGKLVESCRPAGVKVVSLDEFVDLAKSVDRKIAV